MRLALLLLFLPGLLLGIIYYQHLSRVLEEKTWQELRRDNDRMGRVFVEPYLSELTHQFNLLYGKVHYQDFLAKTSASIDDYYHDWQQAIEMRGDLKFIYVGTDQRRIFATPQWVPDDQFDPRVRPWYLKAVAAPNRVVWTEPYYDYLSGELVVAMARTLLDERGRVRGVFAMDTVLNRLSVLLERHLDDVGGEQMIVNRRGILMAHPDSRRLLKPMGNPGWLARMSDEAGLFLDKDSALYVAYRRLNHEGWWMISTVPERTIGATIDRALFNVAGMIVLSSALYLLVALIWSRYFRRMIDEIRTLIRDTHSERPSRNHEQIRELKRVYEELAVAGQHYKAARQQANLDTLTGLYNRRYFDTQLATLLEAGRPFCLGMLDLDNFKLVNDRFGHQTGDYVLKRVAAAGQTLLNEHGWLCRYGGEELVVLLLESDESQAFDLLEQMRLDVSALQWRESKLHVTLSGGLVRVTGGEPETGVARADLLVYEAKRRGKNRICREEDLPSEGVA